LAMRKAKIARNQRRLKELVEGASIEWRYDVYND